MSFGFKTAMGLAALVVLVPTQASARHYLQCVPFARDASGIELRGNANTWWHQAEGKYARGSTPREGAVLAFPGHGRMWAGHVAMVSKVVGDREILLTHANWSHRGGIERNVRAVDVSDAGDWSKVRVWFAPTGDLGLTSYPTQGFIYADAAARQAPATLVKAAPRRKLLSDDVIQLAMLEQ
jgi:surface antigen